MGGIVDVDLEVKALRIVDKVWKLKRFAQQCDSGGYQSISKVFLSESL